MAATGQHVPASAARRRLLRTAMYALDVQGWPADRVYPPAAADRPGERAGRCPTAALAGRSPTPDSASRPDCRPPVLETAQFSLVNSGNRTLMAPKRSWKVDLDPGPGRRHVHAEPEVDVQRPVPDAGGAGLAAVPVRRACPPPGTRTPGSGSTAVTSACSRLIEQVDKAFLARTLRGQAARQSVQGLLWRARPGDAAAPGRARRRRQRPPVPLGRRRRADLPAQVLFGCGRRRTATTTWPSCAG